MESADRRIEDFARWLGQTRHNAGSELASPTSHARAKVLPSGNGSDIGPKVANISILRVGTYRIVRYRWL